MRKWVLLFMVLANLTSFGQVPKRESSQKVAQAVVDLTEDIREETEALNALRARIEEQRIPLARELQELQEQVLVRRKELEAVRRAQNQEEKEQREQRSAAQSMERQIEVTRSLLLDYARSIETRSGVVQNPQVRDRIREAQSSFTTPSEPLGPEAEAFLMSSVQWIEERIGGWIYDGIALDSSGVEVPGRILEMGPTAFFVPTENTESPSLLVNSQGTNEALLFEPPSTRSADQISLLFEGKQARVPVDPSGGDAFRVAERSKGWIEQLKEGGFTMIPLGAVALAAILLSIAKFIQLSSIQVREDETLAGIVDAIREGDEATATRLAEGVQPPVSYLVRDLITYRDSTRDHLEEILSEHVLGSIPLVERNLGALAVLGGVAPLLGLLGTVTGMIRTFDLVTLFGTGDASILSGGISEALMTTKVGLVIAIPTLLVHAFLSRRARTLLANLEALAITLVNDVKLRRPGT